MYEMHSPWAPGKIKPSSFVVGFCRVSRDVRFIQHANHYQMLCHTIYRYLSREYHPIIGRTILLSWKWTLLYRITLVWCKILSKCLSHQKHIPVKIINCVFVLATFKSSYVSLYFCWFNMFLIQPIEFVVIFHQTIGKMHVSGDTVGYWVAFYRAFMLYVNIDEISTFDGKYGVNPESIHCKQTHNVLKRSACYIYFFWTSWYCCLKCGESGTAH